MISFPKEELEKKIFNSGTIFIVLSSLGNFDEVAGGTALSLSLSKAGKNIQVVADFEPTVEFSSIVGIDKIKRQSEGGNFVVSIKDALGSIEKVTHYLDGETLNLVLHPLSSGAPISVEKISFSQSGVNSDLVFLIGKEENFDLSKFDLYEDKISSKTTVVIITSRESNLGNLPTPEKIIRVAKDDDSSISETVAFLIKELNLPNDPDISQNLFRGLSKATDGFSVPPANFQTFEVASWCLKNIPSDLLATISKEEKVKPKSVDLAEDEAKEDRTFLNVSQDSPPSDWLKPKILKSSSTKLPKP